MHIHGKAFLDNLCLPFKAAWSYLLQNTLKLNINICTPHRHYLPMLILGKQIHMYIMNSPVTQSLLFSDRQFWV